MKNNIANLPVNFEESLNKIVDAITWKSVEETLPEFDQKVLIVYSFMNQYYIGFAHFSNGPAIPEYGKKAGITCHIHFGGDYHQSEWEKEGITHWMPLPELPEGLK